MFIPELIRKEGLRQGLRPRTIQTYQFCTNQFFRRCTKDPIQEIGRASCRERV